MSSGLLRRWARSHASFIWRRLVTRVRLVLLVTTDLLPLGGFRSAADRGWSRQPHRLACSITVLQVSRIQSTDLIVSRQDSAENRVSSPQFKVIQLTTRRNGEASHKQEQSGVKDQRVLFSPPDQQHKEPTASRGITFFFPPSREGAMN